jgi:hypothetical protein
MLLLTMHFIANPIPSILACVQIRYRNIQVPIVPYLVPVKKREIPVNERDIGVDKEDEEEEMIRIIVDAAFVHSGEIRPRSIFV